MEGCAKPYHAKGYCSMHLHRLQRGRLNTTNPHFPDPEYCIAGNCDAPVKAKGYCDRHYMQWRKGRLGNTKPYRTGPWKDKKTGYMKETSNKKIHQQHRLIAERILGRPLPRGAQIHHVDENRANNDPTNLVICPSFAYHRLLHLRTAAYDATGHADYRRCVHCGKWDAPANMIAHQTTYHHGECRNAARRQWYAKNRERYNAKQREYLRRKKACRMNP
jgi:hypothetical protein